MQETSYGHLDPLKIVNTIERLSQRIEQRFPGAGLGMVCKQLEQVGDNMKNRAQWIGKPVRWLRIVTGVLCILILLLPFVSWYVFALTPMGLHLEDGKEFITLMEAMLNDLVLIGAAIFFFLTLETRYKRQRALKAIHELRTIAHVIDMHQLTKDPHRITKSHIFDSTSLSPKLEMTSFQLRRYLDYCSEMLSLVGKIAAVYVQEFDDGVALASVSELETLTTGLSSKIWQKISILEATAEDSPVPKIQKP